MNKYEILYEFWLIMLKKCLKEWFDDEKVLLDFIDNLVDVKWI